MKKHYIILVISILSISLVQCERKRDSGYIEVNQNNIETAPGILNPHETEVDANKPFYQGTVLETIDSGGYTYIKVKENLETYEHKNEEGSASFWIVVEKTPASIGDEIRFQKELVTKNYTSKSLNRTFDEIMFASNIQHKVK